MAGSLSDWFNRLSVKWKVLLPFAVLAAAVSIVTIGLFYSLFSSYQESVVADRARHISDSIVYALETMRNVEDVERYVDIVGAEPDVDLLLVLDPAAATILTSNRNVLNGASISDIADEHLRGELEELIAGQGDYFDIHWNQASASHGTKASTLIGRGEAALETLVFVRIKSRYVTAEANDMATKLMSGLGIGLLLAMLVVSKLLIDFIVKPLSSLREVTQAARVNTGTMAPFTRRMDELGALARSILTSFTEARESAERFALLAQTDSLTGLGNRAMFREHLQDRLILAEQDDTKVILMILDLDRFKEVNDSLGHHVGDELLVHIADVMRANARSSDILARLGGDEFAIVLSAANNIDDALARAERILDMLSQPLQISGHEVQPGVSIGMTVFPDDGRDIDILLKNADLALYQAKKDGRGHIQLYRHELHLCAIEKSLVIRDLRTAIRNNQFSLYYQPKVELGTGKISAAEALVRWHHPERGMVPPDIFIPLAEECGLICEVTDWVLETACQQIRTWMDTGAPPVNVAVNVSAFDLRRPDFSEHVAATLVRAGVSPKFLEIEVTESTMMHDVDQVIGTLRRLRSLGISISIDDFGTGYSSLSYLKKFPVQRLKIDRSFVCDMTLAAESQAISKLIIDLAQNLDVSVLAEGVETEEQRLILLSMGCTEAQGYLFSPPVSAEAFEAMLTAGPLYPTQTLALPDLTKRSV